MVNFISVPSGFEKDENRYINTELVQADQIAAYRVRKGSNDSYMSEITLSTGTTIELPKLNTSDCNKLGKAIGINLNLSA